MLNILPTYFICIFNDGVCIIQEDYMLNFNYFWLAYYILWFFILKCRLQTRFSAPKGNKNIMFFGVTFLAACY